MRSGLLFIAVLAAALAVVAAAAAEPSNVTAKRADAQHVLAEIQAIDMQLDKAVEAYDGATVRLQAIDRDLAANRQRLVVARNNLSNARQRVATASLPFIRRKSLMRSPSSRRIEPRRSDRPPRFREPYLRRGCAHRGRGDAVQE